MKKLILVTLLLFFSGCSDVENISTTTKENNETVVQAESDYLTSFVKIGEVDFPSGFGPGEVEILEDENTKCQYLFRAANNDFSVSPYYDEQGNVKGCKSESGLYEDKE